MASIQRYNYCDFYSSEQHLICCTEKQKGKQLSLFLWNFVKNCIFCISSTLYSTKQPQVETAIEKVSAKWSFMIKQML